MGSDSPRRARVLVLVLDERAAGLNLVKGRHIFLYHALHATDTEKLDELETQAIGRVRRFGQPKGRKIEVWRFIAKATIDEHLWARTKKYRVRATTRQAEGR